MPQLLLPFIAIGLRYPIILLLCCMSVLSMAQADVDSSELASIQIDTNPPAKRGFIFRGRPGKSMLFSLIIPGSGQIYNKSYLRVPFVWAAVGGVGYLLHDNTVQYNCARKAYMDKVDNLPVVLPDNCPPKLAEILMDADAPTIKVIRDNANEYRQLSIIGFSLVWLANGIDAFVDAHLKDFDVDDDLSIQVTSKFDNDPYAPMRVGMFITLK